MQENDRRERHKRNRGGAPFLILYNKKRARQHHRGLTSKVHPSQVERIGIIADAKTTDVKKIITRKKKIRTQQHQKKRQERKQIPISEGFFFSEKIGKKKRSSGSNSSRQREIEKARCCRSLLWKLVRKWRSGGRAESLTHFTATAPAAPAASERERLAGKEGHGIGNKISNLNVARMSDFFLVANHRHFAIKKIVPSNMLKGTF